MDTTSDCNTVSLRQQLQIETERVSKLKVLVIREKKGAANLQEQLQSTLSDVEAWKAKCVSLESRLQEVVDNVPAASGTLCEKEIQYSPSTTPAITQQDVAIQQYDNESLMLQEKITNLENELTTRTTEKSVHLERISYLESQLMEFETCKSRLCELERSLKRGSHESGLVSSESCLSSVPTVSKTFETNQHREGEQSSKQLIPTTKKVAENFPSTTENYDDQCLERMNSLETHVLELKEFVEDQVDRANTQAMEVMQKLKLQAADYDHLIRGKESEIFSLRESCDRLSEEVSMLYNFYCSLMQHYITDCNDLFQEIPSDWSILADQTDISDSLENRFQLLQTLGSFQDHLQTTLKDCARQSSELSDKVKSRSDAGVQCTTMAEEVGQLNNKLVELESSLTSREQDRTAMQEELANLLEKYHQSEEKSKRMKAILVKVKCEMSESRMTAPKLEALTEEITSLRTTVDSLTAERDELQATGKRLETEGNLVQQQVSDMYELCESLRDERDQAKSGMSRLQAEFSAYKLKALHALRGNSLVSTEHRPPAPTNPEVGRQATNGDDQGSFAGTDVWSADRYKALQDELSAAHVRLEEVSLDASLARTECELVRQELMELRSRYSEVTTCLSAQKQQWESKVADITQQRDAVVSSRIRELEKLLANQQAEFHKKILEEQARLEQRLREESRHKEVHPTDQFLPFREEPEKPHSRQSTPPSRGSVSSLGVNTVPAEPFRPVDRVSSPILLPLEHLLRETATPIPRGSTTPDTQASLHSPASVDGRSTLSPFSSLPASSPAVRQQVNSLRSALANQQRRVGQLSELLNDSESTVARLIDQSKILKDEIRRLEQQKNANPCDTETQDEQTRLQYLKEVLLRLVRTQKDSVDRQQLTTVLATLLKMNVSESQLLAQIGLVTAEAKSWTSYIVGS